MTISFASRGTECWRVYAPRKLAAWVAALLVFIAAYAAILTTPMNSSQALSAQNFVVLERAGLVGTAPVQQGNGISYHGGPVMHGNVALYFIWYGSWHDQVDDNIRAIVSDFATDLGGTPYYNIVTTYSDHHGSVLNALHVAGSVFDDYTFGKVINDDQVGLLVQNHAGVDLPFDVNGIYVVVSSPDVVESTGFCTIYCAFHGFQAVGTSNLKVEFIGNSKQCPYACTYQNHQPTPNDQDAADSMASFVAHETAETVTDPLGTAWYGSIVNGDQVGEVGDPCLLDLGTTYETADGARANVLFDSTNYLIQTLWVNRNGGYCSLQYP